MKRTEKITAKHLSFSASSLYSLQCQSFVFPSCLCRWRGLSIALLLVASLTLGTSAEAKSMTTVFSQPNVVAAADTSMVAYTEKKTRTKIPSVYKNKIDSVLKENLYVIELNGTNSWSFTTDFVIKEMESDWGISKDNQLLFIWNIISKQLAGDYIYDGEDGDSNRLEEYRTVVRTARLCGQRYKDGIMPFIEKKSAEFEQRSAEAKRRSAEAERRSAEAERRSAEAERRSAEAERRSAEARKQSEEYERRFAEAEKEIIKTTINRLNNLVVFYSLYKNDPSSVKQDELKFMQRSAKEIIQDCKEYNIDYKSKLSSEVRKFFGVE